MAAVAAEMRPLMRVPEKSELVSAYLTPDSVSGAGSAASSTLSIYRFDSSGSLATAKLLASIDGSAASASAWSQFRAKLMLNVTERIVLNPGDTIAVSTRAPWSGALSLRFRRVVE